MSPDPAQAAAWLSRNAVDCLPEGALARKLELGRPLRVKLGIDPTAPDIHLGFTVVLQKLREFQDAGHTVVLIIGDYTARVGDPSGRSATRPVLSAEEIDANAASFQAQALKVLDPDRLEVRFNGEWLDMTMADMFRLLSTTTVAHVIERDDFAKRLAAGTPVSMLELLYPAAAGLRLGRRPGRRRAGWHRPEVQPAARARHPARLRTAGAGDPDDAAADRHRRRTQDVEVLRQLHRGRPSRRPRSTARRSASRMPRSTRGMSCCSDRRRRPTPLPAMRSARSPARWSSASMIRRQRLEAEAAFDRVHLRHELPEDLPEVEWEADGRDSVHLPAAASSRRLASRPRRRGARSRRAAFGSTASPWRATNSISRSRRSTDAFCSWESGGSPASVSAERSGRRLAGAASAGRSSGDPATFL